MNQKETITSAIVETPLGVLVVQDRRDLGRKDAIAHLKGRINQEHGEARSHRLGYLLQIMQCGRFRLPGGPVTVEDFNAAGITEVAELRQMEAPENSRIVNLLRESVARNVRNDLGLETDKSSVFPILEIIGGVKNQIICLARTNGHIELDRAHLCGLGFISKPSALPLTSNFLNLAALKTYRDYLKSPLRGIYRQRYQSDISVSSDLIDDWFMTMYRAYLSLSPLRKRNAPKPAYPEITANFRITRQ